LDAPIIGTIPTNRRVVLLSVYGEWAEVGWRYEDTDGPPNRTGWVELKWLKIRDPISPDIVTPTAVSPRFHILEVDFHSRVEIIMSDRKYWQQAAGDNDRNYGKVRKQLWTLTIEYHPE
jgi:hypothetical protein